MSKIVEGHEGRLLEVDERSKEPALKAASIVAAVGAVLSLAVSWGLDLTELQQGSIMTLATVVAPLAAGWLARRKAWSGKAVDEVVEAAKAAKP